MTRSELFTSGFHHSPEDEQGRRSNQRRSKEILRPTCKWSDRTRDQIEHRRVSQKAHASRWWTKEDQERAPITPYRKKTRTRSRFNRWERQENQKRSNPTNTKENRSERTKPNSGSMRAAGAGEHKNWLGSLERRQRIYKKKKKLLHSKFKDFKFF